METPKEPARRAFAERLSEIREGSGRTYGALARRMDVSASTLHRHCVGQTVPMDFGPVAHMATLCGCTGESVVELHRLWILADAERRLRQERLTGRAAPQKVRHEPQEEREPDVAVAPEPREVHEEAPGTGGSPVRRTGRAAYAAAALVSVVLALTLIVAFGDTSLTSTDEHRTDIGKPESRTGRSAPPRQDASPHGSLTSASPSTSPSPSAPLSPSVSGTAGPASAGGDPGQRPGASPSAIPATSSSAVRSLLPFTWSVSDHVWKYGCDHAYLIGRGPADVPPPPVESDAEPWARAVGAVHAAETGVRITVQGRSERAVVLESLRVRVTARRELPRRNVYRMNSGCGGALTPRVFDIDLDLPRPVARPLAGNDSGERLPAVSLPYSVSVTDPEVFLVTGRTVTCDCDWYLELAWTAGERSGTVRIDKDGQPFRTSGVRGLPLFDYDTAAHRWTRTD